MPPFGRLAPLPLIAKLVHALPATAIANSGHAPPTAAPHHATVKQPCAPPADVLAIPAPPRRLLEEKQSPRPHPCCHPSPCSPPRKGAAYNDAWAACLVDRPGWKKGLRATMPQQPKGLCATMPQQPQGLRATMTQQPLEASRRSNASHRGLMYLGMAPNFKASNTVVATLYFAYRCHAHVFCRFGLHARKRMPSPSSAVTSMADQKAGNCLHGKRS